MDDWRMGYGCFVIPDFVFNGIIKILYFYSAYKKIFCILVIYKN